MKKFAIPLPCPFHGTDSSLCEHGAEHKPTLKCCGACGEWERVDEEPFYAVFDCHLEWVRDGYSYKIWPCGHSEEYEFDDTPEPVMPWE